MATNPEQSFAPLLAQYDELMPVFQRMEKEIPARMRALLDASGIVVSSVTQRIKTRESLIGKLELKGGKYQSIYDITDILGIRVITYYTDDVDKVASLLERYFNIDWENSVDKRKAHDIDSFGYLSLHYICSIPEETYYNADLPVINNIRFEVQMRTVLQHAWANLNHDTGYKSGVEVPREYLRNINRLAGMLELCDEQFSIIRNDLADYRRRVQALVSSGNLDDVPLDGESYRSYLRLRPFDPLTRRIASVNQAEIHEDSLLPWLKVFIGIGCKTVGDLDRLVRENSDAAYQIAAYQIGLTDLDIISTSIAPQDLCIAYMLKRGAGKAGLCYIFDTIGEDHAANEMLAEMLLEQSKDYPFMNL